MKTQIESIKAIREDLIAKYNNQKARAEELQKESYMEMANNELDAYQKSWMAYQQMAIQVDHTLDAINHLGNALSSLGEETSIFWGK